MASWSRGIAASIGGLISDVYGVVQQAGELATEPTVLIAALAIGIATSMVAASIPARDAARVDPVRALQKGKYHRTCVLYDRSEPQRRA